MRIWSFATSVLLAIMSGTAPPRARHRRYVATPAESIAGWVHSVAFRDSTGPS